MDEIEEQPEREDITGDDLAALTAQLETAVEVG